MRDAVGDGYDDAVPFARVDGRPRVAPVHRRHRLGVAQPAHKLIWKAWAPLKIKFFMWLAIKDRLWTAERRCRRGLQDQDTCALCHLHSETSLHIFTQCHFTRQVWQAVTSSLNFQRQLPPSHSDIVDWWMQLRDGMDPMKKRGLDSAFMLISWIVWKERNSRVFSREQPRQYGQIAMEIQQQAQLWCSAGAKYLALLGWPATGL